MDYSTFRLIHRLGWTITAPSPFAEAKTWAATAKRLWWILKMPSMQSVWLRDRGMYLKMIAAAKYCEERANA